MRPAAYRVTLSNRAVVALEDESSAAGGPSITNAAEEVIATLGRAGLLFPETRVIYFDTNGRWDELKVEAGRFAGFRLIGARTRREALHWLIVNPGLEQEVQS